MDGKENDISSVSKKIEMVVSYSALNEEMSMENTVLLRAGKETCVRFELVGLDVADIENMRVTDILCQVSDVRPAGIINPCFYRNLLLIDSNLPLIYTSLVYLYYQKGEREHSLSQLMAWLAEENSIGFPERWIYENKLQKLIVEAALGMKAESEWDGGYRQIVRSIVLEKEEKIYRFTGGERKEFGRFLAENCEVYGVGEKEGLETVYEQDGRKYMNLALSIVI